MTHHREPSVGFDYDAIDRQDSPPPDPGISLADTYEFARRIVSFIRSKDRARLTTDCLFLALGDAEVEEETMTSVAKKHGITKAAVSKRVAEIRTQLHLPITANNKSNHACKTYAHTNASPLRLDKSS